MDYTVTVTFTSGKHEVKSTSAVEAALIFVNNLLRYRAASVLTVHIDVMKRKDVL